MTGWKPSSDGVNARTRTAGRFPFHSLLYVFVPKSLSSGAAILVALACLCLPSFVFADDLNVSASVETSDVYVGAPFTLQLQVEGSDKVERPDLSGLDDFRVQEAGGGQNNSQSISIINGKMTRVDRRGYTFNYRLTPQKAGDLTIPPISVTAEGQTRRTQPIRIHAMPPSENEDFKLRLELSDQRCYVGQPIVLTVTWYVGKNVEEFEFNVPILKDKRFDVAALKEDIDPSQQDSYVRIPLGDDVAIARRGRATLDGRQFLTVKFEEVLIPKQAATIQFPQSTVSLRRSRAFSVAAALSTTSLAIAFLGGEPFMKRMLSLRTLPRSRSKTFPVGRPAGFSGLIGEFAIEAQASPTDVSVGDPITLTLKVKGPRYLQNVGLPDLEKQPSLARDFRIPEERATGVVKGDAKIFTQTVRATHSGVSEIPAIELPYFNPKTDRYETARSEPIALKVEGNRIVTAQDAEGRDTAAPAQTELEAQEAGIAHNYDDAEVLIDQTGLLSSWLNSPMGWTLLVVPPLGYAGLLAFIVMARGGARTPPAAEPDGRTAISHAGCRCWVPVRSKTPTPFSRSCSMRFEAISARDWGCRRGR